MLTSITVNKPEIRNTSFMEVAREETGRPVSLLSAIGLLCVSLFVAHSGLVGFLGAGPLAGVLTAGLIFCSLLQWTSMGRARAARNAGAGTQAGLVVAQSLGLFVVELTLNWNGMIQLAAQGDAQWGTGPGFYLAGAIAIVFAWLNLTVKFASCERLATRKTEAPVEISIEPPPAAEHDGDNVFTFMRRDRDLASSAERDGLRAIVKAEAEHRRTVWQNHQAKIDPATKQFRRTPARRRKAA